MKKKRLLTLCALITGFLLSISCGPGKNYEGYGRTPVGRLVAQLSEYDNYSLILKDMNSQNGRYYHKYKAIAEKPDTILVDSTDWKEVSDVFFNENVNNLGMAIISKKDGKVSKVASPAGYNHFVGNDKYGRWNERNGTSFWEFYGQYAFMSSVLNMGGHPARRSYWDSYRGGGYYGSKPYYGPTGNAAYGTKSYVNSSSGKTSTWATKPSTFKNTVRSTVSKSAQQTKTRRSRSSSRYSSSSSRSRGGGFGK